MGAEAVAEEASEDSPIDPRTDKAKTGAAAAEAEAAEGVEAMAMAAAAAAPVEPKEAAMIAAAFSRIEQSFEFRRNDAVRSSAGEGRRSDGSKRARAPRYSFRAMRGSARGGRDDDG
eukprot:807583_1